LQEFLTDKFLERNLVHRYDPRKGRFRTLILTALDNFVKSALRKSTAKKRAAIATVSIEDDQLDCVADQPQDTSEFDTEWALQVIRQVLEKVETESRLKGQDHYWILYERRVLDPAITGTKPPEYISMLEELGFTSATVAANALQTVQRRVRRVAEQIVAEYELSSGDVENELRALRGILSRSSSPS
jgi:RNA polymerase sigma-70 factor (ECF subfamily)